MNSTENGTELPESCLHSDWREVPIKTSWGTLRAKQIGTGTRKVLAIHGWLDNANSFDLIIPYFKDDVTFVSLDLPGHGLSDHFAPSFIYDDRGYVGAIKKAANSLGWAKFTLIGHSMGALVGIMYSAVFPDDVNSLITVDFIKPWSLSPETHAANYKKYYLDFFKNEEMSSLPPLEYEESELIEMMIARSKSLDVASAKILMKRGARPSPCGKKLVLNRDLKAKSFFIGFISHEVWIEYAKAITCPIFILKALDGRTFDTPEIRTAITEAFKEGSKLFRYKEIEGKHHFHLTHPHLVGPAIAEFLRDTVPFTSSIQS